MKKVTKAIIPAAGFGTRFLPSTKSLPKEMLSLIDKPTLQFVVEEAVDAGIKDILIIISRNKESIINHFDKNIELENHLKEKEKFDEIEKLKKIDKLANIYYIRQDEPKGLGHAISLGKSFIGDESFAVLLGDDVVMGDNPAINQLIDAHYNCNSTILGVQEVLLENINKYGIISGKKVSPSLTKVDNMVEKPSAENAPSNIAILGRYVITPKIFEILESQSPGVNNEIQLTDALLTLLEFEDVFAKEFVGKRYDLGSKIGFIKATIDRAINSEEFREDTLAYIKEIIKNN